MYTVYNNVEDINIFQGTEKGFVNFMQRIWLENEEHTESSDLPNPIENIDDAVEYIEEYCDNLDLEKTL